MNKPTTEDIELYIRNSKLLSEEQRREISNWIQKDPEAREIAEWFRSYYEILEGVESQKKRSGKSPRIIQLEPFVAKSRSRGVFVLAAQTPKAEKKATLETIQTFSSETHKTLIRVLYDSARGAYKLHVLSEYVGRDDVVMIEVGEAKLSLISEKGGTFTIQEDQISRDAIRNWTSCKLHLPLAKAEVYLQPDRSGLNVDTSAVNPDCLTLTFQLENDRVQVRANAIDGRKPEKVLICTDASSSIYPFDGDLSDLPAGSFSETGSTLYIY